MEHRNTGTQEHRSTGVQEITPQKNSTSFIADFYGHQSLREFCARIT